MKRLVVSGIALLTAASVTAVALADTTPPPTNPYPGKRVDVMLYVDTVTSARTTPKPALVCTQTSTFPQGARVVFRMWGAETKTGNVLTTDNVKYAYVKIPGQPNLKLNWGAHGAVGAKVNFWSAGWAIPADYPLGVVPFKIVFKTNDNRFGIYQQPAISSAQLTVIP